LGISAFSLVQTLFLSKFGHSVNRPLVSHNPQQPASPSTRRFGGRPTPRPGGRCQSAGSPGDSPGGWQSTRLAQYTPHSCFHSFFSFASFFLSFFPTFVHSCQLQATSEHPEPSLVTPNGGEIDRGLSSRAQCLRNCLERLRRRCPLSPRSTSSMR
jgi:hypothetical protein